MTTALSDLDRPSAAVSERCDCALCTDSPDHPGRRFHDAFRRMAHCLAPSDLAACLAQYGAKTEMEDGSDDILCRIGGLTALQLAEGRAAAARDEAELMQSLRNAPASIREIAADGETEAWLTQVAEAAAGAPGFTLQPTTLAVILHDRRYRLDMPADWMAYANLFEVLLRLNYAHAARSVETIYDLGGYIGLSALYLHSCYPEATVVAVEPDPVNLRYLKSNLTASGQPIRHRIVEGAIAAEAGTLSLAGLPGMDGSTSMVHSSVIQHTGSSRTEVPAIGLRDLRSDSGSYGIKLDIEGGEFALGPVADVLAGAEWILGEFHYGTWTERQDRWLRDLLQRDFTLILSPPRLEMTGTGDYFSIGQDFRAIKREHSHSAYRSRNIT